MQVNHSYRKAEVQLAHIGKASRKFNRDAVKVFFFENPEGNFGDDLNTWLWPKLVPELLDENAEVLLVGIGTLLSREIIGYVGVILEV